MRVFRRVLSTVLVAWLAAQSTTLAMPLMMAFSGPSEEICTCEIGDHATCPMHHGQAMDSADGGQHCSMRAAAAPFDAVLLSLAGGVGVLPASVTLDHGLASAPLVEATPVVLDIHSPLDTPPPRV
jgi:hypothetical protein